MNGPIGAWAPDTVHGAERAEASGALVEWISQGWSWDWFVTGTFARPAPEVASPLHDTVGWSLSDRRWREWVGELDGELGKGEVFGEAYWLRAREPHQFRNATHFHALVGGVGTLSRRDAFQRWKDQNGMARIEPAANERIVAYVTKYVLKQDGELKFSDNLERFRR